MVENCNPDYKRPTSIVEQESLIDPNHILEFVISETGGIDLVDGLGSLRIPSPTLEAIGHLSPIDKERIKICLSNALDDSTVVNLIPKK